MTTTKKPTLAHLDPNELTVHPDNVRRDLGDLRALVRSVKELGVLVPLVVVPTDDGGRLIVAGERRRAAAIEAGCETVPCLVRHDLAGQAEQIAAMVVENVHRKPLSAGEEAAAYEQLAMLDMSDTAIARATGVSRQHVVKARAVAASEVATAAADRFDLTLDQALVLAEFEDDRQAVKALTVCARKDPGQFAHLASRLRQDRERAEEHAATVEALVAAGVTLLDRRPDGKAKSLADLTGSEDGTPLDPEAHSECPGHAAFVHDYRPADPDYYCLDPAAFGHRDRYGRGGRPATPMSEEAKAERREVIENNKQWKAATPVRQEHVRTLLARRTVPKGTLRFVTEAILDSPTRVGSAPDRLVADLLGVECPQGYGPRVAETHAVQVAEARLPLALLAQVAADQEHHMGVHTWRQRHDDDARWFRFLATTGYDLSPIEQHVVDTAAGGTAAAVDLGDDEEAVGQQDAELDDEAA